MSLLTFSRTVQIAIYAMVYLTLNKNNRNNVSGISEKLNVSKTYLAKTVQTLSSKKRLKTTTGRMGGIYLNINPKSIKVIDIVEAIKGPSKDQDLCALGIGECNDDTHCPIHHSWKSIKNTINKKSSNQNLETLSLELAKKMKN